MFMNPKNFICFSACLLLAGSVYAAGSVKTKSTPKASATVNSVNVTTVLPTTLPPSQSTTVLSNLSTTSTLPIKAQSPFSGSLNLSRSTSLVDLKDGTRYEGLDYLISAKYKFNPTYSLGLVEGYSQNLRDDRNNDFTAANLVFTRKVQLVGETFLLGYSILSVLPTSKDAARNKGLLIGLGPALNYELNSDLLINGLSISGLFSFMRNIHSNTTAIDNTVNTQYTSKQYLSISYELTSKFSVLADFIHRNIWSYENNMTDSYDLTQELGYQIDSTFNVGLGHTNSGSNLKMSGPMPNIQFINETTSIVYASLTAAF